MADISQRIMKAVSLLVTSLHSARQDDEWVRMAGNLRCQELTRDLTGRKPGSSYFKDANDLANVIVNGGFGPIALCPEADILRPYDQPKKFKYS